MYHSKYFNNPVAVVDAPPYKGNARVFSNITYFYEMKNKLKCQMPRNCYNLYYVYLISKYIFCIRIIRFLI